MIRQCAEDEFEQIYNIINDGAIAYKGVIPDDCWAEPYMPRHELRDEIAAGVTFGGGGTRLARCTASWDYNRCGTSSSFAMRMYSRSIRDGESVQLCFLTCEA